MKAAPLLAGLAGAASFALPCLAVEPPTISAVKPDSPMSVGRPFTVTYALEGGGGHAFVVGSMPPSIGAFDLTESRLLDPQHLTITWIGWDTEASALPALPATLVARDGSVQVGLLPEVPVALASALATDDPLTGMGQHRGALPLPFSWDARVVSGLLSAAAIVAAALGVWLLRPRRRVARTPEGIALDGLDRLESREVAGRAGREAFWFDLSGILREYIGARFGMRAPQLTTREFLEEARTSLPTDGATRERIGALLGLADRVKFACHDASPGEARDGIAVVRSFVQASAADHAAGGGSAAIAARAEVASPC